MAEVGFYLGDDDVVRLKELLAAWSAGVLGPGPNNKRRQHAPPIEAFVGKTLEDIAANDYGEVIIQEVDFNYYGYPSGTSDVEGFTVIGVNLSDADVAEDTVVTLIRDCFSGFYVMTTGGAGAGGGGGSFTGTVVSDVTMAQVEGYIVMTVEKTAYIDGEAQEPTTVDTCISGMT